MTEATRAFSTDPAQLSSVREFVRAEARDGSFSEAAEDIALAVTEACANSILHTDSPQMTVSIMARRDAITIEIGDSGVFRPRIGVPELDGEAHRGLQLMIAMMDEVAIIEGTAARPGTLVRLVKRKTPAATSR